ncbi:MAG TPA: hypothetical protein VK486_01655 [Thermoleophilaceae bacterium]|nr:hypothetical protein [Thermoleophilaceae bacterium]
MVAFAGLLYIALSWAQPAPKASAVSTTGPIEIRNSEAGAAIFSAEGLVPGWSADGEVSISNSGETAGQFRLELTHLRETPGPGGARLSGALQLVVTEFDHGRSTLVYAGRLSDLGVRNLSVLEPGEKRGYHLRMSFPDSGPHGADNPLEGGRVEAGFLWTASRA